MKVRTVILIVFLVALSPKESSADGWLSFLTEEHFAYADSKTECVSSPPFSSSIGPVIIRADWRESERTTYLWVGVEIPKNRDAEASAIDAIQIDTSRYLFSSQMVGGWSAAFFTDKYAAKKFLHDFESGRNMLIFLNDKTLLAIDLAKISGGPGKFINSLMRCVGDHANGIYFRGSYK